MKEKRLKELAKKIQLEVKKHELPIYLKIFDQLEKLLIKLKKDKKVRKNKIITRIDDGYLTLQSLEKKQKKFSQSRVSKKTLKNNSEITNDGFILFRQKNDNVD